MQPGLRYHYIALRYITEHREVDEQTGSAECMLYYFYYYYKCTDYSDTHTHTTVLWPFFRDHPGEPVPEENFWTLWCKGRLTEADTLTIWLGATPSGLTSAHLHLPPIFFTGRMPFLPPSQHRQSTEGNVFSLTSDHNCTFTLQFTFPL